MEERRHDRRHRPGQGHQRRARHSSSPHYLTTVGNTIFLTANTRQDRHELWKSDGTAAGTTLVKDINPGTERRHPATWTTVNGSSLRRRRRPTATSCGRATAPRPAPPWSRTSTPGGRLRPAYLTSVGGTLFFTANDGTHGQSCGRATAPPPAHLVKDINPGATAPHPVYLTKVNGIALLHGQRRHARRRAVEERRHRRRHRPRQGHQPRRRRLRPALPDEGRAATLYFTANDGTHGRELWKSDGTAAGTVLVKDINPGADGSNIHYLTKVGSTLFFTANDGVHGHELWKSDGTDAGTVLVKDINPGPAGSTSTCLTTSTARSTSRPTTASTASELWKSDGTAAGTALVKDINPGVRRGRTSTSWRRSAATLSSRPTTASTASELWKSDGTDGRHGAGQGHQRRRRRLGHPLLRQVGGTLYFTANDGVHGDELWKSDGTAAGTDLVKDITCPPASPPGHGRGFPGHVGIGAAGATSATDVPGPTSVFCRCLFLRGNRCITSSADDAIPSEVRAMTEVSDFQDLIRRVRAGDEEAAAELVRRYEPAIRRAVRIRLADTRLARAFDSMDVCQSVMASFFVRAALGQYELDAPEQLLKLLATMARHKLADQVDRERAECRDNRRVEEGSAERARSSARPRSPSRQVAARELLEGGAPPPVAGGTAAGGAAEPGPGLGRHRRPLGGSPEALRKRLARATDRDRPGTRPGRADGP